MFNSIKRKLTKNPKIKVGDLVQVVWNTRITHYIPLGSIVKVVYVRGYILDTNYNSQALVIEDVIKVDMHRFLIRRFLGEIQSKR